MKAPVLNKRTQAPDSVSRRDFFRGGAAAVTVTLAPGVTLMAYGGKAAAGRADPGVRWGLLIDTGKCTKDCTACVSACSKEHGWEDTGNPETDAQWIRKVDLTHKSTGREISMPVMCQHCEEPPCVDVCPTGASLKRPDGIVLVDKHACIGCRYCMMACPFKARSFVHEPLTDQKTHSPRGKGTVESCNMCVHRVDVGEIPACVESCHSDGHGAMMFGDLNDPNSEIAQELKNYPSIGLRDDLQLNPGVRYQNI